jgi:hypothetical protein
MTPDEAQNRIWQAGEALLRQDRVPLRIRVGKVINDTYVHGVPTRFNFQRGGDSVAVPVVYDPTLEPLEVVADD